MSTTSTSKVRSVSVAAALALAAVARPASAQPAPPASPPSAAAPSSSSSWWSRYDIIDYVGLLGLGAASGAFASLQPASTAKIGPSFNPASPGAVLSKQYDSSLGAPYKEHETVPFWGVIPFAAAGAGMMVLAEVPWDEGRGSRDAKIYDTMFGFADTLVLTLFTTEGLKALVGRLRPDFQDRVLRYDCTQKHSPLATTYCTGFDEQAITKSDLLVDGRSSFPSGHSSMSFGAAIYASLVLGGEYEWGAAKHDPQSTLMAVLGQAALLGTATWIASSRVADGRHNLTDILAGGTIGTLWANASYWARFDGRGRPRRLDKKGPDQTGIKLVPGPGGVALTGRF